MLFLLAALLAQDPPKVPEGWTVELVAKPPVLRHPSVVCAAPDGRVFVAEDPMDISAPADAALGRILCVHPDGRVSVFAEKLHAVFGLHYLEGRLYVLHNPLYTRFLDGGDAGLERKDLIARTNPKPWAHDWNDHVPANFRLGLDGFFYVAVGDKGIYGAVGRDGSRAELRGGGILRLTPEATRLEIVCSGTRNTLDVAMTAEDELFTYDNTDEHHWMGRLTHMVDGGYYGYPWDFHPRRPWTLWMMADFGPGAATGALAIEEDGLPDDWTGALLLADFGKRSVARVRIARDGATFRVVDRVEIMTPRGENDPFRPVGIALGTDARTLYVCDWAHRDSKAQAVVGRLLKCTFEGPGAAAPKPAWYAPAAMGRPFEASTADLVRGLAHPSRGVRITAQRRLAERGVTEADGPPIARRHAVWLRGGGLDDEDASVRRQAVRRSRDRAALEARLKDDDAGVRFHAAGSLGRLGDAAAVPALLGALDEKDPTARYAVRTALRRLRWWDVASGTPLRTELVWSLRRVYEPKVVEILRRAMPSPEAADVLAELPLQDPPWKGEWWTSPYHPALSPRPARTVRWAGTDAAVAALKAGLEAEDPEVRRACVPGLLEAGERDVLRARYASDPELRPDLLRALKDPALATTALRDMAAPKDLVFAALPLSKDRDAIAAWLPAKPAIEALGLLGDRRAVPALMEAFGAYAEEAASALARMPDRRAVEVYLWGLSSPNAVLRESCAQALRSLGREALDGVEIPPDALRELARLWPKAFKAPEGPSIDDYLDAARHQRGDAAKGKPAFDASCAKCHKVAGQGGDVGPDLSKAGAQFPRAELVESVLFPSRKVREGYGQVVVRLKDGRIVSGAVKSETPAELVLQDAEGVKHAIATADIDARKASELSLMPENLHAALSPQAFADLIAYLESLR
ncbi:MAG TPA: HEAT repeat domain-containing protein [Planctomycetota bacterium]|nr:HEAT repeat domain-containing protein [Planctomycetota bacterium]